MEKKTFLQKYTITDLILIAMLSALTIAVKAVAGTLVRMITGPLGIPGGALAGGFYMIWLALVIALVKKRGSALLLALVQALVLLITGIPGSHGIMGLVTYLAPALAVEAVFLFASAEKYNALHFVIGTMLANVTGTFASNLLFFRLSLLPFLFTLLSAAVSGAVGGFVGYLVYQRVIRMQELLSADKQPPQS